MIRFSKMFFYVTVAVLLVWQLPWCYAFLTLKPAKTPFTMYSSVLGDFVITQLDENKQLHRYDTKGNTYTQQQVDSLLPSLYVRQLTADERFPDTICGRAVSPKDIQLTNFTFKSVPSAINAPQTGLYFLMESMSKRVDLKMPEDAFRFTDKGIEFIRMETNRIDEAKSKLFTYFFSYFPELKPSPKGDTTHGPKTEQPRKQVEGQVRQPVRQPDRLDRGR